MQISDFQMQYEDQDRKAKWIWRRVRVNYAYTVPNGYIVLWDVTDVVKRIETEYNKKKRKKRK